MAAGFQDSDSHLGPADCRQVRVPTMDCTPNCSSQTQNPKHPSDHPQGFLDKNLVSKGGLQKARSWEGRAKDGMVRVAPVDSDTLSFIVCMETSHPGIPTRPHVLCSDLR